MWAHAAAATVTAAASLRTSETARGGQREDWGKSPALRRSIATIALVGLPEQVKCRLLVLFCFVVLFSFKIVTLISSWQPCASPFPLPVTWWGSCKVLWILLVLMSLCMDLLTHSTSGNCTRQETCWFNLPCSVLYLVLFIGNKDATNSLNISAFPNWGQRKKKPGAPRLG